MSTALRWLGLSFLCAVLSGCSLKPSTDAAKAKDVIQQNLSEASLKMIRFQKINGQWGKSINREGVGVTSYTLAYATELIATQRCEILEPADKHAWTATINENNPDFPIFTNNVLQIGEHVTIVGSVIFEKTENRWNELRATKDNIEFPSQR